MITPVDDDAEAVEFDSFAVVALRLREVVVNEVCNWAACRLSAYELQCRAAYTTEYTAAIDIRKLSGEQMVEPPPAQKSSATQKRRSPNPGGVHSR
ncbi:hypothetical protein AB0K20_17190 [Micromonospora matsumotoense]|uniref:hypothetical protein n=1 Tax=Micromonospora matsumotoense TaxID=121616 RepID=UPI003428CEDF